MNTFRFIVDKVRRKLDNWDAKTLSVVGRVTLAQSILLSIPNYFMQAVKISSSICVKIEKISPRFILGNFEANQKSSLAR